MRNKENWYHLSCFRAFCSSWNLPVYRKLKEWLKPGSEIIDVGCGSGEFLFHIADKIEAATGLDLSAKLIGQARKRSNPTNLTPAFQQIDFLKWKAPHHVDTVSFIFVLHEMQLELREAVLEKALALANNVLIADYQTPQPLNFAGLLNWLAEILTSREHFRNFKQYHSARWLHKFINQNQLQILEQTYLYSRSYLLLKISR